MGSHLQQDHMSIKVGGLFGTENKVYHYWKCSKRKVWCLPHTRTSKLCRTRNKNEYNALLNNGLHLNDIWDIQDAKHKTKDKCIKYLWMVDDITWIVDPSSENHQCSSQGLVWLMFTSHTVNVNAQRSKEKKRTHLSLTVTAKQRGGHRELSWWPSQRFKVSLFTIPLFLSVCMKLLFPEWSVFTI